jgi:hypothetical protein
MLMNSVTKQLFTEVFVVPIHYSKLFLVWKDRKQGGGFHGAYPTMDEAQEKADKEGGERNGIEVIDTPTHLCLLVNRDSGAVDEVMIAMPRTKAKISRAWNSMVKLAGGDRFARVYRIATQSEKNAKGTFFNYVIAQSGFPSKPLYQRAEKLYEAVKGGGRTIKMDTKGFDAGNKDEVPGNTEM